MKLDSEKRPTMFSPDQFCLFGLKSKMFYLAKVTLKAITTECRYLSHLTVDNISMNPSFFEKKIFLSSRELFELDTGPIPIFAS